MALRAGTYLGRFHSLEAAETAAWVRALEPRAVGIDAPCRWSADGRMRPAERALAGRGISCFATPGRGRGETHGFYAWMRNGMGLYERLGADHRLFDGRGPAAGRVVFETFPQAVACALAGKVLSAKDKRRERRALLEAAGIATGALGPLDYIDAALCALAAHRLALGDWEALGDAGSGFIVVPRGIRNICT